MGSGFSFNPTASSSNLERRQGQRFLGTDAFCNGYAAWNEGLAVRVGKASWSEVREALVLIHKTDPQSLAAMDLNWATLIREKWDWAPYPVLHESFSSSHLDREGTGRVPESWSLRNRRSGSLGVDEDHRGD